MTLFRKDEVQVERPATTGFRAFIARISGELFPRFQINGSGSMQWGGGSGALDVNLYRVSGSTVDLKTDNTFDVGSHNGSTIGLKLASQLVTATAAEINTLDNLATTVTIALAASATTDGMDITITVKNAAGETVTGVRQLEVWISESSSGIGLTADSYSGNVTAGTGAILTALTAKKHFSIVTAATGIAVLTAVDSANPTDQYVAVRRPLGGGVVVSAASGTNWEGA